MNSQKLILGGIVGGVVFFLLGWLLFGTLFKDFFTENGGTAMKDPPVFWALILGNLFLGFLLAYILGRANVGSAGGGAGTGFVVGLLMSAGVNLIMYATSATPMETKVIGAHVACIVVMWTITGAVVGWVLGMRKKTVAAA